MDLLTACGIVIFLGCAIALYLTRKTTTVVARVVLVVSMALVLGFTVARVERQKELVENVWHKDAPTWAQMPLTVWWDRKVYEDYNQQIQAAIDLWNSRISCTVLWAVPNRGDAMIIMHEADGTKCGRETVGDAEIDENQNAPVSGRYCNGYFDIQTKRLDDVGVAFRIFLHEFGHGIGLDHDEEGAMAVLALRPEPGNYPEFLLPSRKDVMSVRERYCTR